LADLAEQEIKTLLRRVKETPKQWLRAYDQVAGLNHRVLELKVGGGPRLLVHYEPGELTLLRFGKHEITTKLKNSQIPGLLEGRAPAPTHFLLGQGASIFSTQGDGAISYRVEEIESEWLFWLSAEQAQIVDELEESALEAVVGGASSIHAIVGGPGTGKTSILVTLLKRLSSIAGRDEFDVRIDFPAQVRRYIEQMTGWSFDDHKWDWEFDGEIVLVDDPAKLPTGHRLEAWASEEPGRMAVVAFDPLQLSETITDDQYQDWIDEFEVVEHRLSECYRQKQNVGSVAMEVAERVASSSPYLEKTRIATHLAERRNLSALANSLTFTNPTGLVNTYLDADQTDWDNHIAWIKRQHRTWKRAPSVLVVRDPDVPNFGERLGGIPKKDLRSVLLDDVAKIKGTEFLHGMVVLSSKRYADLEAGFKGSGRKQYALFRLLRIPFSRPRDSLAIFVVGNDA